MGPRIKILVSLKRSGALVKPIFTMICTLLLFSLLAACGAPAATSQTSTSGAPATTSAAAAAKEAKPQGEFIAAFPNFGNENFLPWRSDSGSSQLNDIIYDVLVYYDVINLKFIPGLAESWEISPDAMTLTYHLRKGVQFTDGWGELTSEDVKYNLEKHAGKGSTGKATDARKIAGMETPDPYTLVVNFKAPAPTFLGVFSFGGSGACQGIVSKKYVETAGEDAASKKPVGTGPYKVVESQAASYYKLEALDSHWRVVPEFKTLTVRLVPELSTTVAMLKNREIDLASVSAEQLADLKTAGLSVEIFAGGTNLVVMWGGIALPADERYDSALHNKDPWTDLNVRKAMTLAIDRQAICKAIFAGGATPIGVPFFSAGSEKYQYSYDPAAAKQLLAEAGYPNGFSFTLISTMNPGISESPRVYEALAGYWQQIGLDPKINVMDYTSFGNLRRQFKTAGLISLFIIAAESDMLDKAALVVVPDCIVPLYQDETTLALWKEGNAKVNSEERAAYVQKLNQYCYDNYGPMPLVNIGSSWAWNSQKISPFPHAAGINPYYLEYVRHAQPLNTFRLFTPYPGR